MLLLAAALMGLADPVDLRRWKEVALPGAPFRIDVPPTALDPVPDLPMTSATKKGWKTRYGFMALEIEVIDRTINPYGTPRWAQELLGTAYGKDRKNPVANVTDVTTLGYPGAKLVIEYDTDTGRRVHIENLLIRVGQDDWSIQTTHFANDSLSASAPAEEAHIFGSIQPLAPPPVLVPIAMGRLKFNAPARATVVENPLEGEWAQVLDKWSTYRIDDQHGMIMWAYHMRSKPGKPLNPQALGEVMAGEVAEQSVSKKKKLLFDEPIAGVTGYVGQGAEQLVGGEVAVRIVALGDGDDMWGIVMSGPNMARSEAMFGDITKSIAITR